MKTILTKSVRLSLIALGFTLCTSAFSQKSITWKGGTPGMKNDWHCPQNWSTGSVPDEFSNVFIFDVSTTSFAPPVIWSGKVEINNLFIESNALLTIDNKAQLVVYGVCEGIWRNNLDIKGSILILDGASEIAMKSTRKENK